MGKLLGNKIFLIGGSLMVLLALGVVLGLTIVRIQNEQTTITQPKASEGCAGINAYYPGTVKPDDWFTTYFTSNDSYQTIGISNLPEIKTNFLVHYPKGKRDPIYSTLSSFADTNGYQYSIDLKITNSPTKGQYQTVFYGVKQITKTKQINCDKEINFAIGDFTSAIARDGVTGGGSNNPCWVNVPIPKDGAPQGADVSRSPTFSWTYDTTYSSDVRGACVYLWSCAAKTDSCYIGAACGNGASFTSVDFSKFGKPSLAANTTYYWSITVNSYSPPDPKYACMPGYSFTTGAGGATGACQMNADCPSGQVCINGTCTGNNNCTVDSDCASPKVCAEGSCVDPSQTHLACNQTSKTCARKKGSGNNTDGCTAVGTTCTVGCTANSDCPTSQVCQNNVCVTQSTEVNACWGNGGTNGKCLDVNGDGEVNILDFACLRSVYGQTLDKKCGQI